MPGTVLHSCSNPRFCCKKSNSIAVVTDNTESGVGSLHGRAYEILDPIQSDLRLAIFEILFLFIEIDSQTISNYSPKF